MPKSEKKNNSKHSWLVKSYKNHEFLNSPAARTVRVLTEMIEPADRLRRQRVWSTVVFFGSARTLSKSDAVKKLNAAKAQIKSTGPTKQQQKKLEQLQMVVTGARYYEDAAKLAEKLTLWFNETDMVHKHFCVCSGGGPGIMEAANRGAQRAKGRSMGLNISLPFEQMPNPYQTREISFEFHYFFIRKFWFFYLAKALVVFPGGFGTMDELFELLTLIQTGKSKKYMPVILYGSEYWNDLINFGKMVKWGMIAEEDLQLFKIVDDVDEAYTYLKSELIKHHMAAPSSVET